MLKKICENTIDVQTGVAENDRRAISEAAAVPVPASPRDGPRPPRQNIPDRSTNEGHCIMCLEQEANTKLMPCEHAHFCQDCAALIVAGAVGDPPTRPLCRTTVAEAAPATPRNIAGGHDERLQ
eukprot:5178913-Pyramimonas_sp.AAC.1